MPIPSSMGGSTKTMRRGAVEVGINIDISSLVSVLIFHHRTLWLTYLLVSKKPIPLQVLEGWERKPFPGGRTDPKGKAATVPESTDEEMVPGPSMKQKKAKKGLRTTRSMSGFSLTIVKLE